MDYASSTLDLRHAATDRVSQVVVPRRRLFAIDGVGPPEASGYELASRALRTAAATIAAMVARTGAPPPPRPSAEGLWWPGREVPGEALIESFVDRRRWYWEQVVAVPDLASEAQAEDAIAIARHGAGRERTLVRLVELSEGPAAQLLAIGGATSEALALERLLDHAVSTGQAVAGPVHLIHLTPPDLVPYDRHRVIVRVPLAAA